MSINETPIQFTLGDRELLTRLDGKIDTLCEMVKKGTPRCATNMEKIRQLEQSNDRMKTGLWSLIVGFVLLVLQAFWPIFPK